MTASPEHAHAHAPVQFTSWLLKSKRFSDLYGEVMDVVERCAEYMDGKGREAREALPMAEQEAFVRLSMWLTASLMRSASVVLVLRAVGKGEMTVAAAKEELRFSRLSKSFGTPPAGFPGMPEEMERLRDESVRVGESTERFMAALFGELPHSVESTARKRLRELEKRLSTRLVQVS